MTQFLCCPPCYPLRLQLNIHLEVKITSAVSFNSSHFLRDLNGAQLPRLISWKAKKLPHLEQTPKVLSYTESLHGWCHPICWHSELLYATWLPAKLFLRRWSLYYLLGICDTIRWEFKELTLHPITGNAHCYWLQWAHHSAIKASSHRSASALFYTGFSCSTICSPT